MWKDSETELDFLDYDYIIKALKDIICDDNLLPASIGVYGDWGSGKSSLMQMCKSLLEKEDPKIKCLVFNGWLFEGYDDAKTAILGTILDEIEQKTRLSKKARVTLEGLYKSIDKLKLAQKTIKFGADLFFTGGLGTLANITTRNLFSEVHDSCNDVLDSDKWKQTVEDELSNKELRSDIRKFQAEFAKLLKDSKISRLVVFIDELDRCRPDTILETLEAIKLFMFTGKVAFVIGADERHISYAVKNKFKDIEGIQINIGQEYLEKLIQYPIRIPRMDAEEVETYIACLLLQSELKKETFTAFLSAVSTAKKTDFTSYALEQMYSSLQLDDEETPKYNECIAIAKQLSVVLAKGLHGNPRQCKRFLNSLDMRLKMAEYKGKHLDRKILTKVMMLEYIKPQLFNKIADLAMENKLSSELLILEQGSENKTQIENLKIWIQDDWFLNWCKIEPALADLDLSLYFYFTRTSLDEKISRISRSLSPLAQSVLDELLSRADTKIDAAINKSRDLSTSECAMILTTMASKMMSETKIEVEHMKAFLKFSLSRSELHSEALSHLQSFSGAQLPAGSAAYIKDFGDKANYRDELKAISSKWTDNKLLQSAFERLYESKS